MTRRPQKAQWYRGVFWTLGALILATLLGGGAFLVRNSAHVEVEPRLVYLEQQVDPLEGTYALMRLENLNRTPIGYLVYPEDEPRFRMGKRSPDGQSIRGEHYQSCLDGSKLKKLEPGASVELKVPLALYPAYSPTECHIGVDYFPQSYYRAQSRYALQYDLRSHLRWLPLGKLGEAPEPPQVWAKGFIATNYPR